MHCLRHFIPLLALLGAGAAFAQPVQPLGATLDDYDYPYPVRRFAFDSQHASVQMSYMDVRPEAPNGRVVVLLHGKNYCASSWAGTIGALTARGFRVIAPDQVGFCKSSKPDRYQYSFQQLAANTAGMLDRMAVKRFVLVGHSMGGMLATRFALMYPDRVERLVLVDPIGLEDWKAKGVPFRSVDEWYARELTTTLDTIKTYQQQSYFAGAWKPEYERLARVQAGMYLGEGRERVAWAGALTYDMIYTQPVVYELGNLRVPTTLMIGQNDRMALGKDSVDAATARSLGNYPALGREAAARIPHAKLVPLDALGHVPQIEDPARFERELLEAIGGG